MNTKAFLTGVALIAVVVAPYFGASYYSACRQAGIFNSAHSTNWSCGDFFWVGSQINDRSLTVMEAAKWMRP